MDNGGKDLGTAIREPSRLIAHEFSVKCNRLILHSFQEQAGLEYGTVGEGVLLGVPGEGDLGNSS